MAKATAPAKPEVEEVNLAGRTGPEIAQKIRDGEITMDYAENFVASRAVRKLRAAFERGTS